MCLSNGNSDATTIENEKESLRISRSLDLQIRIDERLLAREVKMLLLGPGSSGKSTILKQMKLIHHDGFTLTEYEESRVAIFSNLVEGMLQIMELLRVFDIKLSNPDLLMYEEMLLRPVVLEVGESFPLEFLAPLRGLWADSGVQKVVARGNVVALPENLNHFYSQLSFLFTPDYVPSETDILLCRKRTRGITETRFKSRNLDYRLFDVGGQRSERKKWIHCFENVTAILFLVAISSYDQCLLEDPDSNGMQESLMLFDSILNSQYFVKTSIILFLNKVDIFKSQILISSINDYFPDYLGEQTDFVAAKEFFRKRFIKLNRNVGRKEVYTNFTTAIDTNLIRVVMTSVADIVISRNLADAIL